MTELDLTRSTACVTRDPEKAKKLLVSAEGLEADNRLWEALAIVEEAIFLDQAAALSDDYGTLRPRILLKLGYEGSAIAELQYNSAVDLAAAGKYAEAMPRYLQAIALDPRFLWPLNNLGWDLATAPDPEFRKGVMAREYALAACERSGWNYWAFVSTLAAAYARCENFSEAVRLQRVALSLASAGEREDLQLQLEGYLSGQPHVNLADKVAAGTQPDAPLGSVVQ